MPLFTKTINGVHLHYEKTCNEGIPVIMLHGWGGSLESFQKLKDCFSDTYKIYIVDFPGFGKSSEPPEAWSVSDYTELIYAFLESESISSAIFIGHSFGGRVSIKMHALHPEKISALILCSSAGILPKKGIKQKILYALAKIGGLVFSLPLLRNCKYFAKKVLYKVAGSQDYNKTSGIMRATFKNVIAEDLEPHLEHIQKPTLLVWGAGDTITPVSDGKIMHKKMKTSEFHIVEGARHGVHFQQTEKLYTLIEKFLSKLN